MQSGDRKRTHFFPGKWGASKPDGLVSPAMGPDIVLEVRNLVAEPALPSALQQVCVKIIHLSLVAGAFSPI